MIRRVTGLLLTLAVIGLVVNELSTSAVQAIFFSRWAGKLSYVIQPGPSDRIVFPKDGPSDVRSGYTRIPRFIRDLERSGFRVVEQARFSPALERLMQLSISPPFPEPAGAGLTIRGRRGMVLYRASTGDRLFAAYREVPFLIVEALTFMEDRGLLDESADNRENPVVDWGRLAKAGVTYAEKKLGLPVQLEGGSTLATQIEKYRHSAHGRTSSGMEKLKQMAAASLKVYRSGADTRSARRKILVDYLNTVPLGAAPGYGEVFGLGEGLYAWFGLDPQRIYQALDPSRPVREQARAFKYVLTLLASVRAPAHYLLEDRRALRSRVRTYTALQKEAGVISPELASRSMEAAVRFASRSRSYPAGFEGQKKAADGIRSDLTKVLEIPGFYELDHLRLEVRTTIDSELQARIAALFRKLSDPVFIRSHGLDCEKLLSHGDPAKVLYSFLLFESRPEGNLLRAKVDSLDQPFDINEGAKLELGSTAKLRTLAHYLEIIALLHREMASLDDTLLLRRAAEARDPLTRWAAEAMIRRPALKMENILQLALDRSYPVVSHDSSLSGAGQSSGDSVSQESRPSPTIRAATWNSRNGIFIRLIRDLVRFHQARLPYDYEEVLNDVESPVRRRMLNAIAEDESENALRRAYQSCRSLPAPRIVARFLGADPMRDRRLAMLFFAWHSEAGRESKLAEWLKSHGSTASATDVERLVRAYGNPQLTLSDYGYLLGAHPLDVWCAGELLGNPDLTWSRLLERSASARKVSSAWLFKPRNRRAQDFRLRMRIEQDAFERMLPYWQRLGFPFDRLVPSYGTTLGSSCDRPAALARLMGIIVNDGMDRPMRRIRQLRFAEGVPYHSVMERTPEQGSRVMAEPVARVLRDVLRGVVERGTAAPLAGVFVGPDGKPMPAGGKTGTGDNRFKIFNRSGGLVAAHVINRTASFVFYIGDRYFGVITSFVPGSQAADYDFTSLLPLAVLKLAAAPGGEEPF